MNRLALIVVLTAGFATALAAPAHAWQEQGVCPDGSYYAWPTGSTTWHMYDKYNSARNFYSGLDDADVLAAVTGGWDVWANTTTCGSAWTHTYGGTTTQPANGGSSGTNSVEFFESGWIQGFGSVQSTIAITQNVTTTQGSSCWYSSADQYYNGNTFIFTVNGNTGGWNTDLQSITAHENGHWLGLDHSSSTAATMYASYGGGTGDRVLSSDDEAGVCTIYPGTIGPSETNCNNGVDDDGDGQIDCADSDCANSSSCTCVSDGALPCNATISGTNSGGVNTASSFSCVTHQTTGPEGVYTITSPSTGTVTVNMTGLSADLDLFVTTGNGIGCLPGSCIDSSDNGNNSSESVSWTATGGTTYYVVADGYQGATSSFSLASTCPGGGPTTETSCSNGIDDDGDGQIDCSDPDCNGDPACTGGSCEPEAALACDGSLSGNNAGAPTDVDQYNCFSWPSTGPEDVYTIVPGAGPVTVDLTGLSADVDLIVTTDGGGACDPSSCVGSSGEGGTDPERVEFIAQSNTTYYVVVDGYDSATSGYTLSAECAGGGGPTTETSCTDGVDNDADGMLDCVDPDCADDPACASECENAGECGLAAEPESRPECDLWLREDAEDEWAVCSCFCDTNNDCPSGWECIDIGNDDTACWPGENPCLDGDDDDAADDDDASDDDDDGGGGNVRGNCGACSTADSGTSGFALLLLLGAAIPRRRRA